MKFLKQSEIELMNGGYLSASDGSPISHTTFVEAQQKAHYLVSLANNVQNKTFKAAKVDSFQDCVTQVMNEINSAEGVKYESSPVKPEMPLKNKLAEEALSWINFNQNSSATERINQSMQQFNVLNDFEQFGLFFSEGIVKLTKIYTIAEILEAVKIVEPHLNS
jgi:hypothetical protein